MIARIYETNEVVMGYLWDDGFFYAKDGRCWPEKDVEILET